MTRVKQAAVLLVGLALCSVMVVLGLWQKQVYENQGAQAAARREARPALALTDVAPPSQPVGEGFGRTVTFSGTYLGRQQLLVPTGNEYRVLTPLLMTNGGIVAVVRGTIPADTSPPPPPRGVQHQAGVLAASEAAPTQPQPLPKGQIASVQLSVLAQSWPQPMAGGYVTLTGDEARAQGLSPATAQLPHNSGRLRNGAYALQWWVFAVCAIGMAVKIARDLGRRDLLADESDAQATLDGAPVTDGDGDGVPDPAGVQGDDARDDPARPVSR